MDLRNLPSVDVLSNRLAATSTRPLPLPLIKALAREAIDHTRTEIKKGSESDPYLRARSSVERLAACRPTRIINATGVLLHTNLGRAPISRLAAESAADQHTGYGNLEFDLSTGVRGGRGAYIANLLTSLTGTEAAFVVNNNAAALLVSLAALAGSGNALVSRGELIEIGGSFRLPDLMKSSGTRLIEVGTTNRTRLADYQQKINEAAVVLKVHPSNYRIEGFAEEVSYKELAGMTKKFGVPMIADVGSGLLDSRTPWLDGPPPTWLAQEPGVRQTLEAGADLVLFSGDKMLGGPQAGIIVGRHDLIAQIKKHPISRAVRMDGSSAAALAATLEDYASGAAIQTPFWQMATLDYGNLVSRHEWILSKSGVSGSVVEAKSVPGAGSAPGEGIPSPALSIAGDPDTVWKNLIGVSPPIVGRRREGTLQIDLRTVDPDDDEIITAALRQLF